MHNVPEFQTELAATFVQWSTGSDPYDAMLKKGRTWLQIAGIKGIQGNDIPFLVYRLWSLMSDEWVRTHLLDDACLITGDIVDSITDHEAELLVEIEPVLQAHLPSEGVGSCSPEVTAILTLLDEVAIAMEEKWTEHEEDAA